MCVLPAPLVVACVASVCVLAGTMPAKCLVVVNLNNFY